MRSGKMAVCLLALLLLGGCAFMQPVKPLRSVQPPAPPQPAEQRDPPAPPDPKELRCARAEEIFEEMSEEERIGQLFFVACPEGDGQTLLQTDHPGGLLLFRKDFQDSGGTWLTEQQFRQKLDGFQQASAIPLLLGADEEGGTVTRASRNPNLFPQKQPSPQQLFRAGGIEGLLETTERYQRELLALGLNVNLAPVADVCTEPQAFIYERAFGQDASATADYVADVVRTMNQTGIGCVLKHFPGYGNNADTHIGPAFDERPLEQLRKEDLLPFRAGIEAGAGAVLVSHNIVKALDPALPASLSPASYRLLREELGFQGVAMTDDLAMEALQTDTAAGNAAVLALKAGADLLITPDCSAQISEVQAALREGLLSPERIREANIRILCWKLELGILR